MRGCQWPFEAFTNGTEIAINVPNGPRSTFSRD